MQNEIKPSNITISCKHSANICDVLPDIFLQLSHYLPSLHSMLLCQTLGLAVHILTQSAQLLQPPDRNQYHS